VVIADTASATLLTNRIHNGARDGVLLTSSGVVTLQENRIWECGRHGVWVSSAAAGPQTRLVRNCVFDCSDAGVVASGGTRCVLDENDVFGNGACSGPEGAGGVLVGGGASPTLTQNKIHDNAGCCGLRFDGAGVEGVVSDCDIFANEGSGMAVSGGARPQVTKSRMRSNKGAGLVVTGAGSDASFDASEFALNLGGGAGGDSFFSAKGCQASANVCVLGGANPTVDNCRILDR
jgi:hypothetical protein